MNMQRRQIVCFSGGKDSTAMILAMRERDERIDGLLVTPTGNELPAVWEHWNKIADMVGAPVIVPPGPTLAEAIESQRWEERTGYTFRSPGRDTWPVAMKDLRARFEAGDKPERSIKMLARARETDGETCRMCSM